MLDSVASKPGTRVRLRGKPIAVTLRDPHGVVVREDEDAEYFIVRLDQPALYDDVDGTEELHDIVVASPM